MKVPEWDVETVLLCSPTLPGQNLRFLTVKVRHRRPLRDPTLTRLGPPSSLRLNETIHKPLKYKIRLNKRPLPCNYVNS